MDCALQTSTRRGVLRSLLLAAAAGLWTACRRAIGSSASAVPTLAEVTHIRATQAAQPTQSGPVRAAETPAPATGPTVEAESDSAPAEGPSWPAVIRGPDGVWVTFPLERFYETRYRNASPRPQIDAADWELTIGGWVEYPQSLRLVDVTALPQVEAMRTLECISNPVGGTLIGNTVWRGVRLADVLSLAGLRPGGQELKMTSADGYQTSIPLDLATHQDSLLVFEMDAAPLPVKHGYPLRVLLPGRYGQKQPKWITGMEVITGEFLGTWEARGWSNEARILINSQVWEPSPLAAVSGEVVTISGIAYADESGVQRVEVSADGGITWAAADLAPGPSPLVWTEWRYQWRPPAVSQPTRVILTARATSGLGHTQRPGADESGLLDGVFPNGTSDMHRIVVTVEPSS